LVRQILAGGVPDLVVVVEGVIEINYAFQATRNITKRQKNGQFHERFGL
jgi:hypothetical protein